MERAPLVGGSSGLRALGAIALAAAVGAGFAGCSLILDFDDGGGNNPMYDAANPADAGPVGDGGDPCNAYEPNNSIATAYAIEAGSYEPIGVCPAGDHDFFKFTVDGAQDVVIDALFTNAAGMDLEMRLYDSSNVVIDRSMTFDSNEQIERSAAAGTLLAAGDYVVEIYGLNDSNQNTYTLVLTLSGP